MFRFPNLIILSFHFLYKEAREEEYVIFLKSMTLKAPTLQNNVQSIER
jgi:hypothetical protein